MSKTDTIDDTELFGDELEYEIVRPWWQTLLGGLLVLVLLIALAAQFLWFTQPKFILQHPQVRPLLEQACGIIGCQLPITRDLARLDVKKSHVGPHETIADASLVQVLFENTAPFPQPYPHLAIMFQDEKENVVAARLMAPEDYLNRSEIGLLPPSQPVHARLEFKNAVKDMHAYGFNVSVR